MPVFDFLNSALQVLQKVSLLNNIVNNKRHLYGCNIDFKSISVREYMFYCLLLPQQIPICFQIISTYRTKYVCTGNLQKSNVLCICFA